METVVNLNLGNQGDAESWISTEGGGDGKLNSHNGQDSAFPPCMVEIQIPDSFHYDLSPHPPLQDGHD